MNYIVDFYKNLDTMNLIVFWGIIVVVILLLTFSIIIANKNKELKKLLREKEIKQNPKEEDVPVIKEQRKTENNEDNILAIRKQEYVSHNNEEDIPVRREIENQDENILGIKGRSINKDNLDDNEKLAPIAKPKPNEEEPKFVAEEHVISYNNNLFSLNNIKKTTEESEIKEVRTVSEEVVPKVENNSQTGPYSRNVLRGMSSNQTSPIGIVPNRNQETQVTSSERTNNQTYLNEVSQKLSQASDAYRTEYERKQEEEAIISYEELMRKKDSLKMIDEEEAVISIEELERRKQKEKLYNITENEENDTFIKELKDFRHDL